MIVVDDVVALDWLMEENHRKEIERIISERIDRGIEISVQLNQSDRPFDESYVDLEQIINMDIIVEDESD